MSEYNGDPLKFRLKDGQLETLESMYDNRSIIYIHKLFWYVLPHPVPRTSGDN